VSQRPLALTSVVMRYAPVMTRLRRMPVIGKLVHLVAKVAVPTYVKLFVTQLAWSVPVGRSFRSNRSLAPKRDQVRRGGRGIEGALGADNLLRTWHPAILCELHSVALIGQNHVLAGSDRLLLQPKGWRVSWGASGFP
jgi:hypothetical protein